ncbi:MAG: hypothetical protein ACI93R_003484 [Flavobacteriales bacterium]|jgi:hypothetical protein
MLKGVTSVFSICITLVLSQLVSAGNSCDLASCDCSAIDNPAWQLVCLAQEKNLKERCETTAEEDLGYCSLHGPLAKALPFELREDAFTLPSIVNVDSENRKIASLFWSMRQDWDYISNNVTKNNFDTASQIVKITDQNVDNLYKAQLTVTYELGQEDGDASARKAWKKYASDNQDLAKFWRGKALSLSNKGALDSVESEVLVFNLSLFRMVGRIQELSGVSYALANKQAKAVKMWLKASEIAKEQLRLAEKHALPSKQQDFYRQLVATRIHRASFHALQNDKQQDAEDLLRKSQEFVANEQLFDEILKITEEELLETLDIEE